MNLNMIFDIIFLFKYSLTIEWNFTLELYKKTLDFFFNFSFVTQW